MPADRLLNTVLRAYQDPPNPEQTPKILSSTTSLLTTLSNPLNITLLSSHLLAAPAIWNQIDGLQTGFRIISVFNTAALTVRKHQLDGRNVKPYDAYQPRLGGGIAPDDWAVAVVKGLDDRSSRWQHVLVIAGVLLGMEGQQRQGLSRGLREKLEYALVTAVNLMLQDSAGTGRLGITSTVLALNHAFPLLSDRIRRLLNYDGLAMHLVTAMTSIDGYEDGMFLETIDYDVKQTLGNKFEWSPKSASFLRLQNLASKPLVASMGPLSRLISQSIEHMANPTRIVEVLDHLLSFAGKLLAAWQLNKLSELDPSEEENFFTPDTLRVTFPVLWQLLKTVMFAIVVVLQATISTTLLNPYLSSKEIAPMVASKTLLILYNIHFISSRMESNAFSAYTFVNLTSIDILTRFPLQSRDFLKTIYPAQAGQIPIRPLQRNHDLFYLNTSENFTLTLSASDAESLIFIPASPYLNPTANIHLVEIFEAAHSSMLAVLAAPQNGALTTKILPFYVESLFNSFPKNLSARQFRFAFKTLMKITTPPSPLSTSQPQLAETLLELLYHRALHAPTTPLTPSATIKDDQPPTLLSEQAVLLLTLQDALPNLSLALLEEWLPHTADLLNTVQNTRMREQCKARFWEVLESGEMDVERSAVCVAWWGTRGGRERVLFGDAERGKGPYMSGALDQRESRL